MEAVRSYFCLAGIELKSSVYCEINTVRLVFNMSLFLQGGISQVCKVGTCHCFMPRVWKTSPKRRDKFPP